MSENDSQVDAQQRARLRGLLGQHVAELAASWCLDRADAEVKSDEAEESAR